MRTITINKAIKELPKLIEKIIEDHEELVIASDKGAIIMIDQSEWDSMQETIRLLKDKKSLSALLESHRMRDEKINPQSKIIDEVFSDLQD